jgi:hypothetical protein
MLDMVDIMGQKVIKSAEDLANQERIGDELIE